VASTGVIGEPLPVAKIVAALPQLQAALTPDGWREAADAIRTTDTFAKGSFSHATIAGTEVTVAGIAKGSGMIQPDMATLLAFVFTDAALPAEVLQPLLAEANERSFHAITVDSDSSTSDTLLLFATGQASHPAPQAWDDPVLASFRTALEQVLRDLAQQVVRDGEGASKLITVAVAGAVSDQSARRIALAVANSPLVKTAIAGEARAGARLPDLDEGPIAAHLKEREVLIEVSVGNEPGRAVVWTCDLTHDYISINADYRS
jgi:glutamate N-acetyltransferase/amino-acid N-acetyltransferase